MEQQYLDEAARDDAEDTANIRAAYESGKMSKIEYDYLINLK